MTVAEKHRQLYEAFSLIPDRQERLSAIVERARRGRTFPPEQKIAGNRVPGCVSPVWLTGSIVQGRVHLQVDAEAPVVRGLVRLLCELYDGAAPADVIENEPRLLDDLDLLRDLSPTRRHGLEAVRKRIVAIASAQLASG